MEFDRGGRLARGRTSRGGRGPRAPAPAPAWARALRACALLALLGGVATASPHAAPSRSSVSDLLELPPGAVLRNALRAIEAHQTRRAELLLAGLASRRPSIADHADLLRMRALVEADRGADAVGPGMRWEHPDSPLASRYYRLLGDAYEKLGEEGKARDAWRRAHERAEEPAERAALHAAIGRSFERDGHLEAAGESYLRIWESYPTSGEAEAATARIEQLERRLGRSLRGGEDYRRRGDALFLERYNEPALEAYETALASPALGAAERRRSERQRAHTLFRLRRYAEAAEAYGALPADDEIRISRARSIARAGDVLAGARELERIGGTSSGAAPQALLLAALLFEGEGESARAQALYQTLLRRHPRSPDALGALWRMGWAAYREGRDRDAVALLEQLEKQEEDPLARLRTQYWIARALARAGDASAPERFARLARAYPLSYYGWRAQARAGPGGAGTPPMELRRGESRLSAEDFERASILLEAGLQPEARGELDRLFARARSLDDRMMLAQLYANAGDFYRPQRLMVDAYTEPLARGPLPVEIELWWHAWPAPFAEDVHGATEGRSLEPELVYAVMREESGYRPEVVSVSGARGLLQLMPSTAQQVAREALLPPFAADDLFFPRLNIQLGSAYLEQLLARFRGRASAAVASYNAGAQVVARWLKEEPGEDDEWVEAIPYEQTRGYVKRVLRSLHAYRVLY